MQYYLILAFMDLPSTCYFVNNITCNKNSTGGINTRSQIEFILAKNSIGRNNSYFDTLPDITKDFLRKLMDSSLSKFDGTTPSCDDCSAIVEPIAVSAISLSTLCDYGNGGDYRESNVQKIVDRLIKIDPEINYKVIDNLAPSQDITEKSRLIYPRNKLLEQWDDPKSG